eukprot:Lankesteria_metandrocarpae@DN2137_c0_g1_i1.p2
MEAKAKDIRIKLGILKRMTKEVQNYEKEMKEQEATVQSMKDAGKEPSDIKQAHNCLQDTKRVLPKSRESLSKTWFGLHALLQQTEEEKLDTQSEALSSMIVDARSSLEEASSSFPELKLVAEIPAAAATPEKEALI